MHPLEIALPLNKQPAKPQLMGRNFCPNDLHGQEHKTGHPIVGCPIDLVSRTAIKVLQSIKYPSMIVRTHFSI